jgi:L-rhamnose mutarotase
MIKQIESGYCLYNHMAKLIIISSITLLYACNQTPPKIKTIHMKELVFTCDLKDNPEAIEKYKKYHDPEFIWPEVNNAANVSGYESIGIYLFGNRLVMILRYPEKMELAEINECYAGSDPKMKEWAELMGAFQLPPPGANHGQVWVQMEKIYEFNKQESK